MKTRVVLFLAILTSFGCRIEMDIDSTESKGLLSLSIAPNDRDVIFSFDKDNQSKIYKCDINGNNIKLLTEPKSGESYAHPRYSPSGNKVLFLSFIENMKRSAIMVMDTDGSNRIQITEYSELITEAAWSHDGKSIFFINAAETTSYSPINPDAPHRQDIYKVSLKNKNIHKITSIGAYSLSNIVVVNSQIWFINGLEGPYFINTDKPDEINVVQSFKSKSNYIGCGGFTIKNDDSLYFLSGGAYHLYEMNLAKNKVELLMHNNYQISNIHVLQNSQKVLFSKNIEKNKFFILDLNNRTQKEVILNLG